MGWLPPCPHTWGERGGERVSKTPWWSLAKPWGFLLQQFPCLELSGGETGLLGGGNRGLRWWTRLQANLKRKLALLKSVPHHLLHLSLSSPLTVPITSQGARRLPGANRGDRAHPSRAFPSAWDKRRGSALVSLSVRALVLRPSWESRPRDRAPGMKTGAQV